MQGADPLAPAANYVNIFTFVNLVCTKKVNNCCVPTQFPNMPFSPHPIFQLNTLGDKIT
jgi:hypothetical protein